MVGLDKIKTEFMMRDPGFMFWGLFLVSALIFLGYYIWMKIVERKGGDQNQK